MQSSGNLKKITFDTLEQKFAEREKDFGKKTIPQSSKEVVCLTHIEKNHAQESSRGIGGLRGRGRRNFRRGGWGRQFQGEKYDIHCTWCNRDGHDSSTCKLPWKIIVQDINEAKGKNHDKRKGKALESTHYVVAHCNIGVIEDLFNASLASWKDVWLLDLGATCHMNFQRDFFEEFSDNVYGAVQFENKSKLKTSVVDTIRVKLPRLFDILLHGVL